MLGKRSPPVIGKISDIFISGNRKTFMDNIARSPRSPLELKIQSPRGLKNYDLGGVGLAIVAALEKSSNNNSNSNSNSNSNGSVEVLAKYVVCGRNLNRSEPIPVQNSARLRGGFEELEMDLEDYTFVTCHESNKSSITRVYCDGGRRGSIFVDGHDHDHDHDHTRSSCSTTFDKRCKKKNLSVFSISPGRFADENIPASDFLSSCQLCRKKLHGKDIYMYRGEKGFCSEECRQRQIVMEERKEQCRSEASRSVTNLAAYTRDHIFSPGILAI